jgi:hypothetical protein
MFEAMAYLAINVNIYDWTNMEHVSRNMSPNNKLIIKCCVNERILVMNNKKTQQKCSYKSPQFLLSLK